ncbi:hypothetical protein BDK51DRAFT_45103 [Blyttiomyces helicus]|uniref:Uncharacterized protein n=1 Tax=Blyttiomyces helicus TaxID=388810 RepID=A0A4P9WLI4_9FUNG|nr:hypothetical protein BDK51DRAFT_45103 [Blyttiomyces helicus]|eukprot:RKO92000.1 hypothetical protein BDK51DRAFT_45103 [Blyttiomyces helicus]
MSGSNSSLTPMEDLESDFSHSEDDLRRDPSPDRNEPGEFGEFKKDLYGIYRFDTPIACPVAGCTGGQTYKWGAALHRHAKKHHPERTDIYPPARVRVANMTEEEQRARKDRITRRHREEQRRWANKHGVNGKRWRDGKQPFARLAVERTIDLLRSSGKLVTPEWTPLPPPTPLRLPRAFSEAPPSTPDAFLDVRGNPWIWIHLMVGENKAKKWALKKAGARAYPWEKGSSKMFSEIHKICHADKTQTSDLAELIHSSPVSAAWYTEFIEAVTVCKRSTLSSKLQQAVHYEQLVDLLNQYDAKFVRWEERRDRRQKAIDEWVPPPPPPPPSPPLPINDQELEDLLETVLTAAYEDHKRRRAAGEGHNSRKRRRTSEGDDLAADAARAARMCVILSKFNSNQAGVPNPINVSS